MTDVIIIGAGVAGTFIARELARYSLEIILVDKESDVANETTAANSGIIHAGYDANADQLKGRYNALGNSMYDQVCQELDVPFRRCGSLVIGFNEDESAIIQKLYDNGLKNKVQGLRLLDGKSVLEMEPNLNPSVICALFAPSAGIIGPWELAIALAENAVENGVDLRLDTEVTGIEKHEGGFFVMTNKGELSARYLINCAGVYSDQINQMVTKSYFQIKPRKGHYYVLDKACGDLVRHVIFQCPTSEGKGVLITPTVHGNVLIGPDSQACEDHDDTSTHGDRLEYIKEKALLTSSKIPFDKVIRSFSGIRASSNTRDFIIEEVSDVKGFINVAGFDSPGLSSIPAVVVEVVSLMNKITGGLIEKTDYCPYRKRVVRFIDLTDEEKATKIADNPQYGRVICRCENVTEAEIVECIHRKVGARTVKGVKKRVRPGTGRCQGGFCGPRIMEILSRELNQPMQEIMYDGPDSYLLIDETKKENGKVMRP